MMKAKRNIVGAIFAFAIAAASALQPPVHASPISAQAEGEAQANKALVLKAYQELFGDHDLTALDRYWARDYIQHNPYMTDGVDSVKEYVEKLGLLRAPKFKHLVFKEDIVPNAVWTSVDKQVSDT